MNITKKVIKWLEKKTGEDINRSFNDVKDELHFKGVSLNEYVKEQYADELKIYEKRLIMKSFKDIKHFEREVKKSLCWEDYFKVNGKLFKIFEYGDLESHQYVYFYNKTTEMMIKVEYICPSFEYENGIKIQKKEYSFISLEFENYPKEYLWRTDTL